MNTDLKKVLVIDPVVDVEESYQATEVVYKSGVNKSIYKYTADSTSNQNLIWNNITPPSLTTVVKRDLRIAYSFLVLDSWTTAGGSPSVFNAVNNAGAPVVIGAGAQFQVVPRIAPIQSASSSIELRMNGSATSTSINDYACIYPHLMTPEDMARFSAEMPLQKDNSASYNSLLQINAQTNYISSRSPFAPYGINTLVPTRASYVWKQILGNTVAGNQTYAVYQIDLVEELFISPMTWANLKDKSAGLSNLNNLILNIRFADLNRMVSSQGVNQLAVSVENRITATLGGTGGTVTANAGTDFQTPTLLVEYITQDPVLSARQPQTLAYDYSLIQPFISNCGNWSSATAPVSNFTAQSLRLASIPSKLYLFARPSKTALNTPLLAQTTPDVFLRVTNLSINFNNRINLFATYTESDLYNMSVKNGLQDTFADWKYNTGSVCVIDVSRDIGLEPDEDVGQANKYSTLQISVSLSASPLAYAQVPAPPALQYDFYILVEQPGKCFITASECQYILTGPSSAEVLALTANLDEKIDHTDLEGKGVGGSVFGKVGKLFKSGINAFKGMNPQKVAQGVESAQNLMKSIGLGVAGGAMKAKHSRVY
jgi:hypothetical protein